MPLFPDTFEALSPEQPCGPDPEHIPQVQNFVAVAESQLPATYRDFDRKSFNAKPTLENLVGNFAKYRDIRFLILAAKFSILSDDLLGFAEGISKTGRLLETQWDHVHPAEGAGGNALRSALVKTFDDLPTSVLPLQNATLLVDRRLGPLSWRSMLVGNKKLPARADEKSLDGASIEDAFLRHEPLEELSKVHAAIGTILTALDKIQALFVEKAGYDLAPGFHELPQLAKSMFEFLAGVLDKRRGDPVEINVMTPADEASGDATASADSASASRETVNSFSDASSALACVLSYYAGSEPSSPTRLLVKQSHQLVGKSFFEAMKILAPKLAEQTKIHIGGEAPFTLDFASISALAAGETASVGSGEEVKQFNAANRAEATALMRAVEVFYRRAEPSSPIPLLLERAQKFVAKDFSSLLKEMVKRDEKQ